MSRRGNNTSNRVSSSHSSEDIAGPSREISRRKARKVISSDEESDDQGPTQNFSSTTPASNVSLSTDSNDAVILTINNMVKYFLNFSSTKIPIKRADLSKSVNVNPKTFPEVFNSCKKILKDVYGLEVFEVAEKKSAKVFIVYTSLPRLSALQLSPHQRNENSLLFLILSYIFMKGGEVQEAHLLHFLSQLNIDDNEPHNIFGDVTKLIREKFPRQLYLKRTKSEIEGNNVVQIHLAWGVRAEKEFDKKEVLKVVAGVMNKSPAAFVNQYHVTTQAEDEEMIEIL